MNRSFRTHPTASTSPLPRLLGTNGAIASENHLATKAGADVLDHGGNAVDAVVAAVLVENLVDPHMNGLGGECPIIVRAAGASDVVVVNGNMSAPGSATPREFARRGCHDMPDEGILAAGVPATLGSLVTALSVWGRLTFAEVASAATRLAAHGFPVHRGMLAQQGYGVRDLAEKFAMGWPQSAALYLPDGRPPSEGSLLKNVAFAGVLDHLAAVERAQPGSRRDALEAVRAEFYSGAIAEAIAKFSLERDGLLTAGDLATYRTRLEPAHSREFAGTRLYKCGFWNQGPVVLQALGILRHFDLHAMGHNSTAYLHTLVETLKLVFADREQYFGDPAATDIPADALLSDEYLQSRSALIDATRADDSIRPGDPAAGSAILDPRRWLGGAAWGSGTVHVCCIDRAGNMAAATPSGGWLKSSEVIGELGFPLGNRMMTFYLAPDTHPNVVAPGKRPRTTISPSLATRADEPWMVFGTMGGDQQDQWQLQFFLNRVVFGMSLRDAIDAPRLSSEHFPGFFAPHDFSRNQIRVEPRVGSDVVAQLRSKGHRAEVCADWTEGFMLACEIDNGVLEAACDVRGARSEIFNSMALAW